MGCVYGAKCVFGQVLWPAISRPTTDRRPQVLQWRCLSMSDTRGIVWKRFKRLRVSQFTLALLWVCCRCAPVTASCSVG